MQDWDCYINNWEPCHQIGVDRYIITKTNTDFEAPPHILNSGRVSPRYTANIIVTTATASNTTVAVATAIEFYMDALFL